MRKGNISFLPFLTLIIGTVTALGVASGGTSMDNTLVGVIITGVVAIIVALIPLICDKNKIKEIQANTKKSPDTYQNTEKIKDVLIENIKPKLKEVSKNSEKLDYISKQFERYSIMKSDISDNIISHEMFQKYVFDIYNENAKINSRVIELMDEKESLESEIRKLQTEIKNIEEEYDSTKKECNDLKMQISELEIDCEELKNTNEKLTNRLNKVNQISLEKEQSQRKRSSAQER